MNSVVPPSVAAHLPLPKGVGGFADPRFATTVRIFSAIYGQIRNGGGALAVYQSGEPVVNIWAGSSDAAGQVPWRENTAALGFSTSKGVTAMVVHRLADRGLIDYDAPVAQYWPEFAQGGKAAITVRDVLAHRAGLSNLGRVAATPAEALDHRLMEQRLAAATPDRCRGIPMYHALTFGWLVSGLTRAVTGKDMDELYRTEIAGPLGLTGLYLGRPPAGSPVEVADLAGSRLDFAGTRWGGLAVAAAGALPIVGAAVRTLYIPGMHATLGGADPTLMSAANGSATGFFTADSLARVYAAIAGDGSVGGCRLIGPDTARALRRGQKPRVDRSVLPFWHLGYHSYPTVAAPHAFGHAGINGAGGWCDPEHELAVALISNRLEAARLPLDLSLMSVFLPTIMLGARKSPTRSSREAQPLPQAS